MQILCIQLKEERNIILGKQALFIYHLLYMRHTIIEAIKVFKGVSGAIDRKWNTIQICTIMKS